MTNGPQASVAHSEQRSRRTDPTARGTAAVPPVELLAVDDPRWSAFEGELDRAGVPLALSSRLAWSELLAARRAQLVAVRDADGAPSVGVAITASSSRALPGHEIWRVERLGLDVPIASLVRAIDAIALAARRQPRVLMVETTVVTPDEQRRRAIGAALAALGFRRRNVHERIYRRTITLGLTTGDTASLFAALPENTRRKIRLPTRRGLELREIDDPAYGTRLDALVRETMARTGGHASPMDWSAIIELCRGHPGRSRLIGMFVAGSRDPGDLLAFSWGCHHGEYAHYDAGGSTRRADVNAPLAYALLWDLVIWAKTNGARWFDFAGVTDGTPGSDPLAGISDFKRHFSQDERLVGEEWVLTPHRARARVAAAVSGAARRAREWRARAERRAAAVSAGADARGPRSGSARPVAAMVRRLARGIATRVASHGEFRVYAMPADHARSLPGGEELARDAEDHLGRYGPDEPWHPAPEEHARVVRARLSSGSHVYTAVVDDRLAHWSWLTAPARSLDTDLGLPPYPLPEGSAVLWDDNTIRAARGRGLHTQSIRRRARDAATMPGVDTVVIGVRANNVTSRHNIEKSGFRHVASLHVLRVLGARFTWMRRARTSP
ncbi:Methicillin resistance protein [Gemmatirosa kalamazoonensis]|uniref:Methicillin resistance protein n=2 Tax=Gemmatirosa kalamazoonensis TaxID=861299 RepID=W0RFW2_9BACT|nr:Methicillin resistance protein [Gemmatirosa kalamazoonensis]